MKDHGRVPKKNDIEKALNNKGKQTADLFLFAIQESGSGPLYGIMNLNNDMGAAAFLRAVKHQLSVENTFFECKTIEEYAKENHVPSITDFSRSQALQEEMQGRQLENDSDVPICKVQVSPLLVFLHVDQGAFQNLGYTPFASPVGANSRSIHQEHVEKVCNEIRKGRSVVSQEDFAIFPFQVCITGRNDSDNGKDDDDDDDDDNEEPPPLFEYQCILNRDNQSMVKVLAKKATTVTHEAVANMYKKVRCGTR